MLFSLFIAGDKLRFAKKLNVRCITLLEIETVISFPERSLQQQQWTLKAFNKFEGKSVLPVERQFLFLSQQGW